MAVFCLLCAKRFQTQKALQQHMEVHAGMHSYICSHCERPFPSHTTLKRHLRSHTGKRDGSEALLSMCVVLFPVMKQTCGVKRMHILEEMFYLEMLHLFWYMG